MSTEKTTKPETANVQHHTQAAHDDHKRPDPKAASRAADIVLERIRSGDITLNEELRKIGDWLPSLAEVSGYSQPIRDGVADMRNAWLSAVKGVTETRGYEGETSENRDFDARHSSAVQDALRDLMQAATSVMIALADPANRDARPVLEDKVQRIHEAVFRERQRRS
jgi:hypothetical protein